MSAEAAVVERPGDEEASKRPLFHRWVVRPVVQQLTQFGQVGQHGQAVLFEDALALRMAEQRLATGAVQPAGRVPRRIGHPGKGHLAKAAVDPELQDLLDKVGLHKRGRGSGVVGPWSPGTFRPGVGG